MQYKYLALSALVAAVSAQQSSEDIISVFSVLQTALPSSVVAEAITNSAGLSSQIASEFAAGQTPSWFSGLPSDIQTFLVPLATNSAALSSAGASLTGAGGNITALANGTAIAASQSAIQSSIHAANSSMVAGATGGTSSGAKSSGAATTGSGGAAGASATGGSSGSSSSAAGASMPTAIYGMGLAGAVGLVGILAL